MNTKVMRGLIGVGVIVTCAILWVTKDKMMSKDSSPLTVQKTRQKDFGFKLKVDECFSSEGKYYYIVDMDNNSTYVTADAKQYYEGPHPIREEQLAKIPAEAMDKKEGISKVDCATLERKYSDEAKVEEDKKASEEAEKVAAEEKANQKPDKKSSKKNK